MIPLSPRTRSVNVPPHPRRSDCHGHGDHTSKGKSNKGMASTVKLSPRDLADAGESPRAILCEITTRSCGDRAERHGF